MKMLKGLLSWLVLSVGMVVAMSPAYANEARALYGSKTFDAASGADGVGESTDVTVQGAALGDFCVASLGVDVVDITVTCNVVAANTAAVRFQNETTGTLNLASATLRVIVFKVPAGG